jgi:hypothetical protein
MPLHPYLDLDSAFRPEDLRAMTAALAAAIGRLRDRPDVSVDTIARKIIRLAKQGERDPVKLCEATVRSFTDREAEAS